MKAFLDLTNAVLFLLLFLFDKKLDGKWNASLWV